MQSRLKHTKLSGVLAIGILNIITHVSNVQAAETVHPIAEVKSQFNGVYRYRLGDFQITALSDGTIPLDFNQLLLHTNPNEITRYLDHSFRQNPVETSINAYLVDTGDRIILIDAGFGLAFNPSVSGKVLNGIRTAGYTPEQITDILITHLHSDHIGGLTVEGKKIFSNATIYASQDDADFFLKPENHKDLKNYDQQFFKDAIQALEPYIASDQFKTFTGKTILYPGITAIPAPGHTPGHTFYSVESRGKSVLIIGDLIHNAEVQLSRANITIKFDVNEKAAAAQRIKQLQEISQSKTVIAGSHLPFPGIGQIRKEQNGSYIFIPVLYQDR
ncbi:MBL fold metallo-hydrolase [Acinetobacter gerneri]|uniref:MBL fold metallo-hydrolase n=1 Tax=Acinetobacter gerneri TaxID=202952 RepID=UPI0028AE6E8C|nr:MBL fold metallo-hydrolase [Acinetobacter gerneri]